MVKNEYDLYEGFSARLKPPKNYRRKNPRVCATCKFFRAHGGYSSCARPDEKGFEVAITFDNGDMLFWLSVCDRYSKGV